MKNTYNCAISTLVSAMLVCAMLVPVAHAEDAPQIIQTIPLYEAFLRFPTPIWIKGKEQMGDVKMTHHQEKNSFTLEQIPKAQSFEDWSNLYGVYAWYLPEYDMKRFVDESLNALSLGCKEQVKFVPIDASEGSTILVAQCPLLADELVKSGKSVESSFLFMGQVGHTFVKVYQAWRGNEEDVKTDTWPSSEPVLLDAIAQMKSIRLQKK